MARRWSAERHAAARRPYDDPRRVACELVAEQYAQYLASPQYRRDLKGGARGGYFEAGEILQGVPFLQKSLGRLGFVFDRTGEIVHSPLFGDYRKSPGVAQAVREYTRARVLAKGEGGAAERAAHGPVETGRASDGYNPADHSFYPGETEGGYGKGLSGDDPAARQDFHAAITAAAKTRPAGAIEVKAPEFYTNPMVQLFLASDRKAGVAVGQDRYLVSAFGSPTELKPLLAAAAQRATKLNAHMVRDGAMLKLYSEAGFRPVARAKFDPDVLYGEWSHAELGQPEMVFMVRDWRVDVADRALADNPVQALARVPLAESYEQATDWQAAAVRAPVSSALHINVAGKQRAAVLAAINGIDKVHYVGDLLPAPVEDYLDAPAYHWGKYDRPALGGTGRLRVRENSPWPAITALHETGHRLDDQVFGTRDEYASESHPDLQKFRDAVAKSEAVKKLNKLPAELRDYYLSGRELMARAYAQYGAKKSGDSYLLEQLDVAANALDGYVWQDQDFASVTKTFEEFMTTKGWLK